MGRLGIEGAGTQVSLYGPPGQLTSLVTIDFPQRYRRTSGLLQGIDAIFNGP